MQIIINEKDVKQLKKIKDIKINKYLTKIDNISEDEAIEFMEYLYDKAKIDELYELTYPP